MTAVQWYLIGVWALFSACILLPVILNGIAYGAFRRRKK